MLDFIYDSLDTVKKLKFPTAKQIVQMTIAIFALVIVAGAYFILADTLFSGGYKAFYSAMTEGQMPASAAMTGEVQELPEALDLGNLEVQPVETAAEWGVETPEVSETPVATPSAE